MLLSGILVLLAAGLVQELVLDGGLSPLPLEEGREISPSGGGFALVLDLFLGFLVWPLTYTGYQYLALRAVRGEIASLRDMLAPFRHPLSVLGAYWLTVIVMILGLLLLVIPGIAWGLKFMFAPLAAADKKRSAVEAMGESGALTAGRRWALLGLGVVLISPYLVLGAVTYLALVRELLHWGVWLLITYGVEVALRPWLTASFAAAYHDLDRTHQELVSRLLKSET